MTTAMIIIINFFFLISINKMFIINLKQGNRDYLINKVLWAIKIYLHKTIYTKDHDMAYNLHRGQAITITYRRISFIHSSSYALHILNKINIEYLEWWCINFLSHFLKLDFFYYILTKLLNKFTTIFIFLYKNWHLTLFLALPWGHI